MAKLTKEQKEKSMYLAGGAAPIIVAARCASVETIETLSELGADVEAVDNAQRNILHNAALCNNVPVLKWIGNNTKLDINAVDIDGHTALDLASLGVDCQCPGQSLSDQNGDM